MMTPAADPRLIVPLDQPGLAEARALVAQLGDRVSFYKVGLELFARGGMELARELKGQGKQVFLLVDSLQCLDDGHFSTGRITTATAERSLEKLTNWCKENYTNAIIIGQVTKGGSFAGSNKLKHMVDGMICLTIEKKDKDLLGCCRLETVKNRFGGSGATTWLSLNGGGFQVVAVAEEE